MKLMWVLLMLLCGVVVGQIQNVKFSNPHRKETYREGTFAQIAGKLILRLK